MSFFKNFFQNIKNSVYSPSFYKQIPDSGFGKAFKYYFLLAFVLTLLTLIPLLRGLFIQTPATVQDMLTQAVNYYPQELEVTVKEGSASTNAAEPYFIPAPEEEVSANSLNNLLVIDTKTPYSSEQFEQYKTAAWLTRDTLFIMGGADRVDIRALKLAQVEDFKVDKPVIESLSDKISPFIKFVGPFLFLLTLLGVYLYYTFSLIYILILALVIMLLGKVFKWNLSYGSSFKTAIFAVTLAFFIELIINTLAPYTNFRPFIFMFTLITLAVITINHQNSSSKTT